MNYITIIILLINYYTIIDVKRACAAAENRPQPRLFAFCLHAAKAALTAAAVTCYNLPRNGTAKRARRSSLHVMCRVATSYILSLFRRRSARRTNAWMDD